MKYRISTRIDNALDNMNHAFKNGKATRMTGTEIRLGIELIDSLFSIYLRSTMGFSLGQKV